MAKKRSKLDELEQVEVISRSDLRAWLRENHKRTTGIWLVSYKKAVPDKYLDYASIVEEALCFGWIDSTARALDAERSMLHLCPRKPGSVWSKPNKERVERLVANGSMTKAGMAKIDAAKKDGSWTAIDAVEALEVPKDLQRALAANKTAKKHFEAFPPGVRKQILGWIHSAKTAPTRERRIRTAVEMAAKNERAIQQPKPK